MDRTAALLGRVLAVLPGAAAAVRTRGRAPLADYAAGLLAPAAPGLQSRDDFLDEAGAEAKRLLGADVARALVRTLDARPAALTANHHGVDFLAQSLQGTLLTALPGLCGAEGGRAVPVLACGAVPLGSFTFPRGILLARRPAPGPEADPRDWPASLRVPLFPWKYRYTLALAAPPLTREMVERGRAAARDLAAAGAIGHAEAAALDRILAEDFGHPAVLALPGHSEQATVLNARLWDRLFAAPGAGNGTRLAYLELERLAGRLLARDLADSRSLFHDVLLDPGLRGAVLQALDGVAGCWDLGRLSGLAAGEGEARGTDALRGSGSAFFWGLDAKGRKVPLYLAEAAGRTWLRGLGLGREAVAVELAPGPLAAALAERRILPGLFAAYGCLALARCVRCLGGVYQADYLPAMRAGLAAALASVGDAERARAVEAAPAGEFAAGPEFLFARFAAGQAAAAGPVEILAAGGLTRAQVEQAGALSLEGALRAGLAELYAEFVPPAERDPDWLAAATPEPGPGGGPVFLDVP